MHEILKEITIMKNGVPNKYIIPDYSEELNELKSGMANKANINHVHMEYADKQHTHKEFYTKNEIDNKLSEMQTGGGGATVTNNILKANGIYTLRYDGSAFILQGEGGEYGTATGEQVLEGYTIGTNNGVIDGTIPTRTGGTVIPTTTTQTKAAGYYSDAIIIQGSPNLTAPNIKKGVNIFGVVGTYSAQPDEPTSFTQSINLKKTSPSSATISGGGDAIQYIYYVDVTLATTKTVTFSFSKKSSQTVYIDGTKGVGQHHAGINGNTITVDMTSAANYAAQSGSGSQSIKGYYDSKVNVIINAW